MKMLGAAWIFLILTFSNVVQDASGATCITSITCQTTDYTLSSCTDGTCNCKNSSLTPIRSGCAFLPDKPTITPYIGKSNQVVYNSYFSMYCNGNSATGYVWYLEGVKVYESLSSNNYNTKATATSVGSYTCAIKVIDLLSPQSDPYIVEMLGGPGGIVTSTVQPVLYMPTTAIVSTVSLFMECHNIPYGFTTNPTYTVDGTKAVQSYDKVDASTAGKDVTCTISDPVSGGYNFSNPTSKPAKMPILIVNIKEVTVTLNGQKIYDVIRKTVTLGCSVSPIAYYLGSPAPAIIFTWQKDGFAISGATSPTYTTSDVGTFSISCAAFISGQATVSSSNKVKVTISNDYLGSVNLMTSSKRPIKEGRVVLTCDDFRDDGVSYKWTLNNANLDLQFDRKLQLDNYDSTDDGSYQCSITKNGYEEFSNAVTLTSQVTISTPSIKVIGPGSQIVVNLDYMLQCETDSDTAGMTYQWTVNNQVSAVTTKLYNLPNITSNNNGDYICKAMFKTTSSSSSSPLTVTVTIPGRVCFQDNDCTTSEMGYTGRCGPSDRCECLAGFTQKGEQCQAIISTPTIAVFGQFGRFIEFENYKLQCLSVSESDGMTYEWTLDGIVTNVSSKSYDLTSLTSNDDGRRYVCRALMGSIHSAASSGLTLKVTKPGLMCSLDMDCPINATKYTGQCNTNKRCACSAGYTMKADRCSAILSRPTISVLGYTTRLAYHGDYWLQCNSESETTDLKYEWTIGGRVTLVTTKLSSLQGIDETFNGMYACKTILGSITSIESEAFNVTVTMPGWLCEQDSDCPATTSGYTGQCDPADNRCACSMTFEKKGEICSEKSSGVQIWLSSATLIVTVGVMQYI